MKNSIKQKFNKADVQRFYRWLNHDKDEYTEIRIIKWPPPGEVKQFWIQNEKDFIKICKRWSGKRQVYCGLNPRLREGGANEDVARIIAIPFDIDSFRPSTDVAATEEELAATKDRMVEINSWMRLQDYLPPLIAMSGNGFHILQRLNIPFTDDLSHTDLSSRLESYFFNEIPGSDKMDKILDAARILKVPGTLSVKGVPTEERPHRLSYILEEGDPKSDAKLADHILSLEPYVSKPKTFVPTPTESIKKAEKRKTRRLLPCFKRFAEEGGRLASIGSEDNLLRLALVVEAHSKGYSRAEILELFTKADDFNLKTTREKVDHQLGKIAVEGLKVWSCKAIHKHGGCLGESCRRYKRHVTKHLPDYEEPITTAATGVFFDEKGTFIPALLVKHILGDHGDQLITPRTDEGGDTTWRYHESLGVWKSDGGGFIKKLANEILATQTKAAHVRETLFITRLRTYLPRDEFREEPGLVILKNGVYHINTGKITEHNPFHYAKSALPVTYDPDAKCPIFLKFLKRVAPDYMEFLQEWTGYHLLKDQRHQRFVILLGDRDNGKSTYLHTLTHFLGKENVSNESLYNLTTRRFSIAELHNKLANIAADIGPDEIKYTGALKIATGEDRGSAERKYKDPFSFMNHAKLTFSCNQLPATPDETGAFHKRHLVLLFNVTIPLNEQDKTLKAKLTTPAELSGILNWALEGLHRLLERGQFNEPTTIDERRKQYRRLSNPIASFAEDHLIEDVEEWEIKNDIYMAFAQYCKAAGFRTPSDAVFFKELKQYISHQAGSKTINKKRTKVILGVKLMGTARPARGARGARGTLPYFSGGNNAIGVRVKDPVHPVHPVQTPSKTQGEKGVPHAPLSPEDLFSDAVEILRSSGGRMEQPAFWQTLVERGHHMIQANSELRGNKRFRFMGTGVTLRAVSEEEEP